MQNKVKSFILKFLEEQNIALNENTSLIGDNRLDSMGFLELISALEENFKIDIDFFDVEPVFFTDINLLSEMISKKLC